jgi:hypothetical protein
VSLYFAVEQCEGKQNPKNNGTKIGLSLSIKRGRIGFYGNFSKDSERND